MNETTLNGKQVSLLTNVYLCSSTLWRPAVQWCQNPEWGCGWCLGHLKHTQAVHDLPKPERCTDMVSWFCTNTHSPQILVWCPSWERESSPGTVYCCRKVEDACSIPLRVIMQMNTTVNTSFSLIHSGGSMRMRLPWSQKHMSWWFKWAGQQRLQICRGKNKLSFRR